MQVIFATLTLVLAASARSFERVKVSRQAEFDLQNGQAAIVLNEHFQALTADSPCKSSQDACIGGSYAQCIGGKFVTQACAPGTVCAALPLVNSEGTSVTCTTQAELTQRIAATGAGSVPVIEKRSLEGRNGGDDGEDDGEDDGGDDNGDDSGDDNGNGDNGGDNGEDDNGDKGEDNSIGGNSGNNGGAGDAQTSLTLDPGVIATGFANNGQDVPAAGQVASLTSTNNFINFCKTVDLPLTNGTQVVGGSCNPAPMGSIPAKTNMPSSKFVFPKNGGTVAADKTFTIKMAINNLETGNFVNAQENYFSAPQQLNTQGIIQGHSHVVVEELDSLDQTTTTDPTVFAFFKGLNDAAQGGVLSAVVDKGLPAGFYKLSSINSAANHQPVLAPVAQHGSLDDVVYFTVS